MAPPLLALNEIHLTFGATPLLTGADMAVHPRERLCLVGRNGSGKSTLLRIAAGQLEADRGEHFLQPGTTVRYLPQEPDFSAFKTVEDYVLAGLEEADNIHRARLYLETLGLSGNENTRTLSGGEARRAALVRVLAPQPDILLLDEPTNHLDLPAIEWLESELASLRSAIVLISHDRRFLENLSQRTLWVDRGTTRLLEKGFAAFEDWRDTLLENEERDAHKLGRKIVREEHWVVHGVSGRRKRNMRRLHELAALRKQQSERLLPQKSAQVTVAEGAGSGRLVARAESISKTLANRTLVKDFSIRIARGDRLGIVGPNGCGKSTLIRMLTGELEPDNGRVELGANIEMLIIDQNRDTLDPDRSLADTLTDGGTNIVAIGETRKHVVAYMKDYLFLPEQAGTPVSRLSGGERGRLMLATRLRHPSNLLVLDEPTNDLDLETLDLLQETVADYDGTVIVVSHDRDFLDRVCTSIITPDDDGRWLEYAGGYASMVSQRGAAPFGGQAPTPKKNTKGSDTSRTETGTSTPARAKMSFKDKHALEMLPGEIEKLEAYVEKLNLELAVPGLFESDAKRFNQLARLLEKTQASLSEAEDRWLSLEAMREEYEN